MKKVVLALSVIIFILFKIPIYSIADEYIYIIQGAKAEEKGEFEEAIIAYEKALDQNPERLELYTSIGYIYRRKLKNNSKAIEVYKKGLKYGPRNFGLNRSLMYAYFEKGDLDNGIKQYKLLPDIGSDKERYSFPRDTVNKIIKDMKSEEIIKFCKEYLEVNPKDLILRDILSDVYIEKRDYKNAKEEYENMLKYGYSKGPALFGLAICDYYLGYYKEALNSLMEANQLGEDVPQEYFNMIKEKMK